MSTHQPSLPFDQTALNQSQSYRARLETILAADLSFHGQASRYASHNFHSFPAKCPPQLAQYFIAGLSEPDDIVLDPRMGSGTTVLEAYLSGRQALGRKPELAEELA